MFKKLQAKWKVNGWQLLLIITTFAIGGSLTGWAGRKLLALTRIDHNYVYYIFYIIIITLLWPPAVLLVSIFFGQFSFFRKYIKRIWGRMKGKSHAEVLIEEKAIHNQQSTKPKLKIAIFASGTGTNAEKIIEYFRSRSSNIEVALIVCNKPSAGVLAIAEKEHIPSLLINKEKFFEGNGYADELKTADIDFIVLAGFLWKIPSILIQAYPNKIVNIHPALLPKYGGKNMYGNRVHESVITAREKETGITIHYVDEQYDHGRTIFQATCPVMVNDTPDTLAKRVHTLEHEYYPKVIERCLKPI